jgi:hypothetical protein
MRAIWSWHAGAVLAALSAALVLPLAGLAPDILRQLAEEPVVFTLAALGLVTGPLHFGILPLYLWLMLATPFVLRAFRAGQAPAVFALSALLWMIAQTALPDQAQLPVEASLAAAGHPINIGLYFNLFGWQVLYVAGLWFGWRMAQGKLDLSWLRTPPAAGVAAMAFAAVLLLAVYDVIFTFGFGAQDWRAWVFPTVDRGNLHVLYLFAFAVCLYLVAWIVVSGRPAPVARGMVWLFTRQVLTLLGRHSLQVFVAHLAVVYALTIWAEGRDVSAALRNALYVLSPLPVFAMAVLRERWMAPGGATAAA